MFKGFLLNIKWELGTGQLMTQHAKKVMSHI